MPFLKTVPNPKPQPHAMSRVAKLRIGPRHLSFGLKHRQIWLWTLLNTGGGPNPLLHLLPPGGSQGSRQPYFFDGLLDLTLMSEDECCFSFISLVSFCEVVPHICFGVQPVLFPGALTSADTANSGPPSNIFGVSLVETNSRLLLTDHFSRNAGITSPHPTLARYPNR